MSSNKSLITGIIILILIAVGAYVWSASSGVSDGAMMDEVGLNPEEANGKMDKPIDQMMETDQMMKDDTMMKAGSYEAYDSAKLALAETGDVVLFFRASWCPTCRTLDADIRANLSSIPEGVTILDLNYDDSTALKQKYGVTYQHTLVQVDSSGNQITKWTGSPTLASLVMNIK